MYAIRVDVKYSDSKDWEPWCYSEVSLPTHKAAREALKTIVHNATYNGQASYTKGKGSFKGMHMVKNQYVTRIYTIVTME